MILQQAERDRWLKTILWEIVPLYLVEEEHSSRKEAGERLQVVFEHLQVPPGALSLAHVAAQLQIHLAYEKELSPEIRANLSGILKVLSLLLQSEEVVPDQVDLCWVQEQFQRSGLVLPRSFAGQFLQTARELSLKRKPS